MQEDFMNGETKTPLLVFPEGTITSGRHLIKFKRGAFDSLLPIKPYIMKNHNKNFDPTGGSISLGIHFILALCYLYHSFEIIDLPIIEPNDYTFNNYSVFSEKMDKVEIYLETTRSIMSEIGNFEKSEKGFRDNSGYSKLIKNVPLQKNNKCETNAYLDFK